MDDVICAGVQGNESPKHKGGGGGGSLSEKVPPSSGGPGAPAVDSHVQLKYENDRLKLALAQRFVST